jgi:hypothetical protein
MLHYLCCIGLLIAGLFVVCVLLELEALGFTISFWHELSVTAAMNVIKNMESKVNFVYDLGFIFFVCSEFYALTLKKLRIHRYTLCPIKESPLNDGVRVIMKFKNSRRTLFFTADYDFLPGRSSSILLME